jgi:HK97 family phage major capsid protein
MFNTILKSRLLSVAIVMGVALIAFHAVGAPISAPELAATASLLPFMLMGDTVDQKALTELLQKQGEAFEEFKKTNDQRLKAIEEKGYAPADIVEKVDKINSDLSQLNKDIAEVAKKAARPQAGRESGLITPEQEEYKQAFGRYVRKGDVTNLSQLERKAFQMGSDVDGGYLIHSEMEAAIDRVAGTVSAARGLCDVRTIGKPSIELRVKTSGVAARWVGEGETGGESANPKYAKIEISAEEMEIEPWAYNSALEDADFDVEADIIDEAGIGFGEAEGDAIINGNGVKKPRGILSYPIVANSSFAWGKVGYIPSGASGDFATSNPGDKVIDLIHSLKSIYRTGAQLLMADTTLAKLRQIKDGIEHFYLFQPDVTGQFGGFVLGVPVVIDDNMPVIGANSYSIAYGNFSRAYRIVDRRGITLIRDNLTTKGTTKFNLRKRVGGGIKNYEAIKLMKFNGS